jgi:uracil-DNA glycosylase family protein
MKAAHTAARPAPASSLAALREAARDCRECPIGYNGTRMVWGEGASHARLMLVGEQPGDQEEQQGRPFVGPAGRLLGEALAQLGWPRETLYVTNAVKHFKFELRGKRRMHKTPGQREALACAGHWLESEIAAVRPEAAVALGGTAARALLRRPVAVLRERGQWQTRETDGLPVLVTLHPSALLRLRGGERDAAFDAWLHDLSQAAEYVSTTQDGARARRLRLHR